ncbi:hypothetical protein [Nocardia nova]|uniref:hypothetical protein n=1 Tax=Nocardia nova TaxID=37330 RepID=UPI001893999A|nr:hypothetical protein [Nocardia nova]MBF6147056.1 hypothetical protein [Nocardia nova]
MLASAVRYWATLVTRWQTAELDRSVLILSLARFHALDEFQEGNHLDFQPATNTSAERRNTLVIHERYR